MSNSNLIDSRIRENVVEIFDIELDEFEVIDIREPHEQPVLSQSIVAFDQWPLSEFGEYLGRIDKEKKYLFFCQAGVRSLNLIEHLHDGGYTNTYSLDGGVFAFQHIERH